mmetsp:Transcript_25641/g.26045  ORF Transcript_25641/g.26045 Transcript_25641/m.26045 type:complete len:91 (+) Transcript_25641:218-490(+)
MVALFHRFVVPTEGVFLTGGLHGEVGAVKLEFDFLREADLLLGGAEDTVRLLLARILVELLTRGGRHGRTVCDRSCGAQGRSTSSWREFC